MTFRIVLALAAMTGLSAAGCGGSAHTTPPAIGLQFQHQALAVCRAALTQKRAEGPFPVSNFNPTQPDPSQFPRVVPFFAKAIATYSAWLHRMRALGQPPGGRTAWADLLKAIGVQLHLHQDQRAAALRGDTATFVGDYQKGFKAIDNLQRAADAAGVSACASVVTTAS